MTPDLIQSNLLTWTLQVTVLVLVAAFVPLVMRLTPKARLAYWQTVLLAAMFLPIVRDWKRETVIFKDMDGTLLPITRGIAIPVAASLPPASWILLIIAAGGLARLGWLLTGVWRMRQFRRNSTALEPPSSWSAEADLRISGDVDGPVTFGYRHPVVLLPRSFPQLDQSTREAILCHEILHVRRKDWLFTLAEELLRTVLWFHPAIWWVLGEIQLAREQTVDREVIGLTRSRDEYVDALLAIAGASSSPDLAPAPLFLRKRHLKQRVVSILKEVHMSKTRSASALAASLFVLAASCWFITGALPLYGAPQVVSDGPGVAVEMNGAPLMHRSSVPYPPEAAAQRIEGVVVVQMKLDSKGNVADATVLSGPEQLRKAALQSVLNWHFARTEANGVRQVSITFANAAFVATGVAGGPPGGIARLPTLVNRSGDFSAALPPPAPGAPPTLKSVEFSGSEQARAELMALLPVQVGDQMTAEMVNRTMQTVREYDEHLRPSFRLISPKEMQIVVAQIPESAASPAMLPTSGPKIRVGAKVVQANLLTQVHPVYPALAKAARVQGTVQFEATIAPDGHIDALHLLSGPPLLVQAAMEAVQQWVYKPTLLNGNPVGVITTIEVNFTLAE